MNTFTYSKEIVKYRSPEVDFTAGASSFCPGSTVTYTSQSTAGDGFISSYLWEFGDGNTLDTFSSEVSHQYFKSRTVSASLSVTNNYGCITSVTKNNIITILKPPVVNFTPSSASVCSENDPITFENSSTNAETYVWDFGDGTISTEQNPTHKYEQKGEYLVQLKAISSEGCFDTSESELVTVANSRSDIKLPTLLCLNSKLLFEDSSTPKTSGVIWLLDDEEVARRVSTFSTTFTDLQEHKLQIVNLYGTCSDTATKFIRAQATPELLPFDTKIQGKCGTPATVFVADTGTGYKYMGMGL